MKILTPVEVVCHTPQPHGIIADLFVGYLMDEKGKGRTAPVIGKPLMLGKEDSKDWIFRTDTVKKIMVLDLGWIVETRNGDKYTVRSGRTYQ